MKKTYVLLVVLGAASVFSGLVLAKGLETAVVAFLMVGGGWALGSGLAKLL